MIVPLSQIAKSNYGIFITSRSFFGDLEPYESLVSKQTYGVTLFHLRRSHWRVFIIAICNHFVSITNNYYVMDFRCYIRLPEIIEDKYLPKFQIIHIE